MKSGKLWSAVSGLMLLGGMAVSYATEVAVPVKDGTVNLNFLKDNTVRVTYGASRDSSVPELVYISAGDYNGNVKEQNINDSVKCYSTPAMSVYVDTSNLTVSVADKNGVLFSTEPLEKGRLIWSGNDGEHLYGLGQFQDGFVDVKNLSRRLTQVNTQISVPMVLSSNGYGILWNNYGLTEFNPSDSFVSLDKSSAEGERTEVDVTSTEGNKKELRESNRFSVKINIPKAGRYALLLDAGQKMARSHNLAIDGKTVIDMHNLWLPPTASTIVELSAGEHQLEASLEKDDKPVVGYRLVDDSSEFYSPMADNVDFTVFAGSPDEVVASYRSLTGEVPMLPRWGLGYVHCRERFHSQDELLSTASKFRERGIPVDVIVQDWQYWGKLGWNAMDFDKDNYPDPALMVDSLHAMDMHLMLSVWSKIDPASEVGKKALAAGHYIPDTDWIDFFDNNAADFYWDNFSSRLLPYGIDAWWQDATEPENDDLDGRYVRKGTLSGEKVRNVYPVAVNERVYKGLREDDPLRRTMIMTRSGFSGIQRYGVVLWSGDVGNDWTTFRRQIAGGLGLMASGIPWWTYDAGGFFRPRDQYNDADYIERMLRWIQTGVYLPMMRVHGYMSNTEPWNYGEDAERIIKDAIGMRYRLLPYIYSNVRRVSNDSYTLMRPLVFDFGGDERALCSDIEYMFGDALLVSPVTEGKVTEWTTYLPENAAGWYDFYTGTHYKGGRDIVTKVDMTKIPVFAKGGSIVPMGSVKSHSYGASSEPVTIHIYPGADASFELYEDNGHDYGYENGEYSVIPFKWDDVKRKITVKKREGVYSGMPAVRKFIIAMPDGYEFPLEYRGDEIELTI